MGILEELRPKNGRINELAAWIASRPKAEREEWLAAMKDEVKYSSGAIARLLTAKGFAANENLVFRFRKREALNNGTR